MDDKTAKLVGIVLGGIDYWIRTYLAMPMVVVAVGLLYGLTPAGYLLLAWALLYKLRNLHYLWQHREEFSKGLEQLKAKGQ